MIVRFRLTGSEMHLVAVAGIQRGLDAIRHNRNGAYGCENGPGFDLHIEGCAGELALAKHLNRYWNGAFGDLDVADVGQRWQVRATHYATGHLLLHEPDNNDHPFVLAIVNLPYVRLAGWILARDGKQKHFWKELQNERPCYCVPQKTLCDMETLPV